MENTYIAPAIALFIFVAAYWYWVFELIDHLLKASKLKKILRIPVGIINSAVIFILSAIIGGTTTTYILISILLFLEFKIFYDDTNLRNLFCTAACVIHVLVIRGITTGIFSAVSGISIYELSHNPTLYAYSVLATFVFLNIALWLVLKLLPLDKVRIVNEHRDQQIFLVIWMVPNILYLLFNSAISEDPVTHFGLVANQIIAPCMIMLGTYIMLIFAMRTGVMLGYKEKNKALEITVSNEKKYRSSITKDAIVTYEFNLNKDLIINDFKDETENEVHRYSDTFSDMAHNLVYKDDIADFAMFASPSNIIKEFEQGKSEITIEFRKSEEDNTYIWCRAVTNLVKDNKSGDIVGFTCVKNIDAEKRSRMELQYKAERDSLTGLYNKGITEKLIREHLVFNHTLSNSALFMIDIDDFKDVNDNMGHACGDKVLCQFGEKLLSLLGSENIVGRIGGDEYVAFMKYNATEIAVREKAQQICTALRSEYKDSRGEVHTLSSSVGIAISPKDGITFDKLYRNADIALYVVKSEDKDNYRIYDGEVFKGYQSNRNHLD